MIAEKKAFGNKFINEHFIFKLNRNLERSENLSTEQTFVLIKKTF